MLLPRCDSSHTYSLWGGLRNRQEGVKLRQGGGGEGLDVCLTGGQSLEVSGK